MSASNSNGIQALLEAEKTAQESVQEARAFRSQRLKASKTDAAKEIEDYKKKKESEFSQQTSEFHAAEDKAESSGEKSAQSDIEALKKSAEKSRAQVVKYLVEQATTV